MTNLADKQIRNSMFLGLDPEKESEYQQHMEYMKEKYADNIDSLNKYYSGMEEFICFLVICSNARAYKAGKTTAIWPGAGKANMPELIKDVEKLDSFYQVLK